MFNDPFNPFSSLKDKNNAFADFNFNLNFADFDFKNAFNKFNLLSNQPINLPSSNIASAIRQQLNLAEYCFNTTFNGVERFIGLNISTARNVLEVALSSITGMMSNSGIKNDKNSQVMVFLHPALENSVEYTRKAMEIGSEVKSKLSEKFEQELQDSSEKMGRFVERSLAYAPLGGRTATTAIKSSIQMANDAFNGLNKASEKIDEVTQANVNAALTVTSKTLDKIGGSVKSAPENVPQSAEQKQEVLTALVAIEETKKTPAKRSRKSAS